MIASGRLAWLLSAVFAVTGIYCLARCLTPRRLDADPHPTARVGDLCHVLMAAGMIAMIWPWGTRLPRWPQMIVFALATAFFLARMIRPGVHGRPALAQHAVTMAVMVGMVAAMPTLMPAADAMGSMPGMTMASTAPSGILAIAAAIACGLVLVAAYRLARSFTAGIAPAAVGTRRSGALRGPAAEVSCHALMSLGMAAMLLALL